MSRLFSAIFLGVCFLLAACGGEGHLQFLHEFPGESKIVGTYELDPAMYSYEKLRAMGYKKLNAQVVLMADHTFRIGNMPDCWLTQWSSSHGGYDSCVGTWQSGSSYSVYVVSLDAQAWGSGSTYLRERGSGSFSYTGAFTLTKSEPGCGLAVALQAGDDGYIYFVKSKSPNQALEPTTPAVTIPAAQEVAPAVGVAHL